MESPNRFRIPDRLNTGLVLLCAVAIPACVVWGDRAFRTSGVGVGLVLSLVAFSLLFLTNYSLFHEASHFKLHSKPKWNRGLGVVTGIFFLCPYSLYSPTHWRHHLQNRTQRESFDLILGDGDRSRKTFLWYLYLVGAWYWMIPFGSWILAFSSDAARKKLMDEKYNFANFRSSDAARLDGASLRLETLVHLGYILGMIFVFHVSPWIFLAFYVVGTIWWSTTQYVDHAYSDRDVLTGAFNLEASSWFSWINLHREYDLNHHLFPHLSWIYLPRITCPDQIRVEGGRPRKRFLRHYLAQWSGPSETAGPSPEPLREVVCDENVIELR
jgi:fatty acid desaturase